MLSCGASGSDLTLYMKIIEAGYVLEIEDKRVLTEQQAREFYSRKAEEVRKSKANKQKKPLCFQILWIPLSFDLLF